MYSPVQTMRGVQQRLLDPPALTDALPAEARGVVFTKRWVVDLLLDLAGYRDEIDLGALRAIEPSCGDGAFFLAMIERLAASCVRHGRRLEDCGEALAAFEVDSESVERTRSGAVELLRALGRSAATAAKLANQWIQHADYLLEAAGHSADFVLGNPPYVRLESMPEGKAKLYRDMFPAMTGRADLYVAFFEAALQQLRPNGVCGFICADRWMRNQYGAGLRALVTSAFSLDVMAEMHQADAFDSEVDAYPSITILRAAQQGPAVVATLSSEAQEMPTKRLGNTIRHAETGTPGVRTAVVDRWFHGSEPWPCESPAQLALLRRLEDRHPPLEASAKVGIGVATGNDSVFITRDPDLVEPGRQLKLAMGGDAEEGNFRWSGHYLVDPWDASGLVPLKDFPRLKAYFERHSDALRRRHTAAKNQRGWYRTIDRVTHSLVERPKLYIPDIKSTLEPVLDWGETYPHHNLYYVLSGEWDIEALGGLLLSEFGQFFVRSYCVRMRGGYFRFQAQYLRRIRVPAPGTLSKDQIKALRDAFSARDRERATAIALKVYGVDRHEWDAANGN